ncbi:ELWxxDGT repeat protein [Hyunsoonleella rubra]|uniref:ELWxxDGT repeat protein n=1 Tax=Hyunsoonleella rubra TaxID=1737062 RepID=A0ABW5TBY0_9FLAO
MKTKLLILLSFTYLLNYAQVSQVKDINSGSASSNPENLTIFNNGFDDTLYFTATTTAQGNEMWKSNDATSAQTTILADINPNTGTGSFPKTLTKAGNFRLYFTADDGTTGREIWYTNGVGATLYFDLYAGSTGSNPTELVSNGTNGVFASCHTLTSIDYGTEIVNTASFSITDVGTGALNGEPENLYFETANNIIYFSGNNQSGSGKELYQWNDGSNGTLVADINTNPMGDSNPNHFINLNDKIYFSAEDGNVGNELFELDYNGGNQVVIVKDININAGSSNPGEKIVFNNKIYFSADDGINGTELWESDGTNAGTQLVFDLYSGIQGSNPKNFTIYNNRLYFSALHPSLGTELFYMTTSGNVILASNIASGASSSNPEYLKVYNGKLYFSATDGINGIELWETSGTAFSTLMTADINTAGSSDPSELVVMDGNKLVFSADDGVSGRELWKYIDPTLSSDTFELDNQIVLFPNPANDTFSIRSNLKVDAVLLMDISGKQIKTFKSNLEDYSIRDIMSGMYFVNIQTDKGSVLKKLVKN